MILPKDKEGLRIDLKVTNDALLCKWIWRYLTELDGLWKLLINSKYNVGSPWI